MKSTIILASFLIAGVTLSIQAQDQWQKNNQPVVADEKPVAGDDVSKTYAQANSLLSKGAFGEALPLWLKLAAKNSDKSDYYFKLGLCYLNSYDKQVKSLPYLKVASKNVTDKYSFNDKAGKAAPTDVLYFIGKAYMHLNNPDSALSYFLEYKDKEATPIMPVDKNIRMAMNARTMFNSPMMLKYQNLGEVVNSASSEVAPVLAVDGKTLFFASRRLRDDKSNDGKIDPTTGGYYLDIYYSTKDNAGNWQIAKQFDYNGDKDDEPVFISEDGKLLYIARKDKKGYNLYTSAFVDGVWQKPIAVKGINTMYNESGAGLSVDGKMMVFASDRVGGQGKSDLYVVTRSGNGKWSSPKSLGNLVNTPANELHPFLNAAGKRLFFASDGHEAKNMGGYDIFYCDLKDDGTWTEPVNAGYPINSTRDDIYYYATPDGARYTASISDQMNHDLYAFVEGQFDQKNLKPGTIIQLTKEEIVTEIVQLEKEIEKEVQITEIVEKEVQVEKEVTVTEIVEVEKENPELAKIKMEQAKAEAQAKQADADKAKAEAEIRMAEAETKKAEADKAKADAEKAKSDAIIAEATKLKAEADIKVADAAKAKADAIIAKENAKKAKIDAKVIKEKAKVADAERAKADAERAKAEADKANAEATIAAAEKAKSDAARAQADAEKAKAESDAAVAKQKIAESEKAKADAEKAKADAVIAASEKAKSEAEKSKADAALAADTKAKAEADAKIQIAEADKSKAEATVAESQRIKALADQAKAEAQSKQAETDKVKAEAQQVADEKAKADAEARTAAAQAEKAKADQLKAEADAKQKEAESVKAKAEAEKSTTDAERIKLELQSKQADAEKAKADAQAKQAETDKAKAEAQKAADEKAKAELEAKSKQAELDKAKAEQIKAEADAKAKEAEATRVKLEAEKTAAEAQKQAEVKATTEANAKLKQAEADKAKADAQAKQAELEKAKVDGQKIADEKSKVEAELKLQQLQQK